jgi:hypothetical protein
MGPLNREARFHLGYLVIGLFGVLLLHDAWVA